MNLRPSTSAGQRLVDEHQTEHLLGAPRWLTPDEQLAVVLAIEEQAAAPAVQLLRQLVDESDGGADTYEVSGVVDAAVILLGLPDKETRRRAAWDQPRPPATPRCDFCEAGNVAVLGWHEQVDPLGIEGITRTPCPRYTREGGDR